MDNIVAVVLACLALAGTIFGAIVTLVRGRRTDDQGDRQQDTVANDLILKLVTHANTEVGKWQVAYDNASAENTKLRADLAENLAAAVDLRDRMQMAIDYLVAIARAQGSVTVHEVITWADTALDRTIPIDEFRRRMQPPNELDEDTIRPEPPTGGFSRS